MIKGTCVYELIAPSGHTYVGISKNLKARIKTHKRMHLNNIFEDHMKSNGFTMDDIKIRVHKHGLTRKQALSIEQKRIHHYEDEGKCLNYFRRKNLPNTEKTFEVEMPNGEQATI